MYFWRTFFLYEADEDLFPPMYVQGFENTRACQKGIVHIIWPHDCANQAQNKAKPDMIRSVDPNFTTSNHRTARFKGRYYFWLALFSPEQVEFLKASTLATVSATLLDAPWKLGRWVSSRPAEMPGKTQRRRSRSIRKREAVEAIRQQYAPVGLSFLSTAEGTTNAFQQYDYLSAAGVGIRGCIFDIGVDKTHPAFHILEVEVGRGLVCVF